MPAAWAARSPKLRRVCPVIGSSTAQAAPSPDGRGSGNCSKPRAYASRPTAAPTSPAADGRRSGNAALQLPRNPQTPGPKAVSVQRRPEPKPRRTKNTRSKAAPGPKPLPVKSRPGPKPRRPKSRIVVPPLPLGSEPSASPKDARQKRLCEAPSARRTIKGRPAKAPARRAIKDSPKRHPARQKIPDKCAGKDRPAKTGPKDPLRTQHPERPPCKPSCGPKIAGKFGVPQQNRYLRTYRTTPAAGQYSRPSDRLPGKSTA